MDAEVYVTLSIKYDNLSDWNYVTFGFYSNIHTQVEMDNSKFLEALGARIKALRTEQNLSQQELAGICDFEKANMSRIENGGTNPTILTLLKICAALRISLSELMNHADLKSFNGDE